MDILKKVEKAAKRQNFSQMTIDTYLSAIKRFLKYSNKELREMKKKDVIEYLDYLCEKKKSPNTLNVYFSSIKFLFKVYRKNWRFEQKFSRRPRKIPVVLSKQEIKKMLNVIEDEKHYIIVALMYSAGLRLSELTNLRTDDLFIKEGYGIVRQGKGRKDRLFIIANALKPRLTKYIENKEGYMFKGRSGKITRKTVYLIVKKYSKIANIKKNVHPHTLRHSFATHLIENNYQIEIVQRLLGHSKIDTTQIYIHSSLPKIRVISPFDTI